MRKQDMGAVRWRCLLPMFKLHKTIDPVRRVVAVRRGECYFYRSKACLQKVVSRRGLKSRLQVAKMHLNGIKACALSYRTVARCVKELRASCNESVDLCRTGCRPFLNIRLTS
ncbi:hypothetical protein AVEN_183551-1 [Araneus ventricosus]|uniref:Uncharacterized protein n=1 Tax=Araneus ventricosus TaxID=182803 RepID=A0A4Y2FIH7_ARAVE|nr:hypothetical protein AVEN_183551-1 [Araneus ventricosus]